MGAEISQAVRHFAGSRPAAGMRDRDLAPQFGLERAERGLHESLIRAIDDVPKDSGVLDLGCGSGAWLRRLKNTGYSELFGIERSGESASNEGLTIVQADLSDPAINLGRTFKLVTLIEVIEHLANPGIVLETARRHLDDDGVLLITTPNVHSLLQRIKFAVTGRFLHFEPEGGSDPTHIQPLLLSSWKQMLPTYGLTIERVWSYPAWPSGLGAHPAWRFAARMAKPFLGDDLPGNNLCLRLRPISGWPTGEGASTVRGGFT